VSGNFETLLYEKDDGIAHITLNRPDSLNVYNIKMRDELYQLLEATRDDPDTRVVVFSGAGDRAFCAGADLSEFLTAPSPVIARQVRFDRDVWGMFLSLPQPLIAALHGHVLGSGIEIALCCDLRLAADNVRFGLPEPSLGIIPAAGGTQTLPRTIGRSASLEMLLAGRRLDAREALASGLVNRVVPREALLKEAMALAGKIASLPSLAVRYVKEAITRGADLSLDEGLDLERRLATSLLEAVVGMRPAAG